MKVCCTHTHTSVIARVAVRKHDSAETEHLGLSALILSASHWIYQAFGDNAMSEYTGPGW